MVVLRLCKRTTATLRSNTERRVDEVVGALTWVELLMLYSPRVRLRSVDTS
jgi:hypothetical protein